MPWYFKSGDQKVNLEDLPLDVWIKIEAASGLQWPEVLTGRCVGDAKVANAVVNEVSAHLGVEVPKVTLSNLMDIISFEVKESIPEQFNDGVPDPKAAGSEPETT